MVDRAVDEEAGGCIVAASHKGPPPFSFLVAVLANIVLGQHRNFNDKVLGGFLDPAKNDNVPGQPQQVFFAPLRALTTTVATADHSGDGYFLVGRLNVQVVACIVALEKVAAPRPFKIAPKRSPSCGEAGLIVNKLAQFMGIQATVCIQGGTSWNCAGLTLRRANEWVSLVVDGFSYFAVCRLAHLSNHVNLSAQGTLPRQHMKAHSNPLFTVTIRHHESGREVKVRLVGEGNWRRSRYIKHRRSIAEAEGLRAGLNVWPKGCGGCGPRSGEIVDCAPSRRVDL